MGTTVGAYPRRAFVGDSGPFSVPVASGVTAAALTTAFSGLAYDTQYWAAALVGGVWRRVAFTTDLDPALSSDLGALNARVADAEVSLEAVESGSGQGTKRAAYSCGIPMQSTTGADTEGQQRLEVTLPVTTTRWRLHVRNWRPNTATVVAGAIPFNGVWIGEAKFEPPGSFVGQCIGAFVAAPAQALASFSTPSDGGQYVSSWVTDPTHQFEAMTSHLISMGWVGGPTTHARMNGGARGFYGAGAGSAANASVASGASVAGTVNYTIFDIWIEYEFTGQQAIGLALGDSLTAGYTQAAPGVRLPDTWPHRYALLSGCPMLNVGVSGVGAAGLVDPANGAYVKWDIGGDLTVPDFAIVWVGINDAVGQQPVGSVAGYYQDIIENLRDLGIERIYLCVLPPFGAPFGFLHGTLLAPAAAGATSITTSVAFAGSDYIVLDYGLAGREQVQVGGGGSTGTGPYTTPVAALANAHKAGAQVWTQREASRRDFNVFLRGAPNGVQGLIDMESVIASPTDPFVVDPAYASADLGHLNLAGYTAAALAVPTRLVVPT